MCLRVNSLSMHLGRAVSIFEKRGLLTERPDPITKSELVKACDSYYGGFGSLLPFICQELHFCFPHFKAPQTPKGPPQLADTETKYQAVP